MDSDTDNDLSPENSDDEKTSEEGSDDYFSAEKLAKLTDYNIGDENSNDGEDSDDPRGNTDQIDEIIPVIEKRILHFLEFIDKRFCPYALRPLYQDVTPSFADEVPFLVDGDSLMITIMMDKNWSNQLGGSSLHLIYLFERYLNIFIQRGGTFHLVFFENWRNIWHTNWNILLHRSILMNHFSRNVKKYPVHLFKHSFDEDFSNFVSFLRPGFILTNMDAYENCADFIDINKDLLKHIVNVNLINWLKMDLPCIHTDYLDVNVSIVRGYYLECNYEVKLLVNKHINKLTHFITNLPTIENCLNLPDCIKIDKKHDIRKATFLTAAYLYYKKNKNENMVKIFLLTCAMMDFLQLKNRCCPKFTIPPAKLDEITKEWHKCMFFALSALENQDFNYTVVSDMWQGILFGHICRFVLSTLDNSEKLGSELSCVYENMVKDFNKFESPEKNSINPYPIELNCDINFERITFIIRKQKDHKPLIPIKNQLNFSFCGDILNNIKWCDAPDIITEKQYTEEHHYHTMKVLTDEHDHIKDTIQKKPTDEWQLKWYYNSRNLYARYMTLYGSSIEGRLLKTSAIIRNSKNSSNTKKEKVSKKKKEILDAKIKKDLLEQEKKDKEKYEKLKKLCKNHNRDLDNCLYQINLLLENKLFCEGSYKIETLFLKLNVLRTVLKDKAHIKDKDMKNEKVIFLTAREILNSGRELSEKNKITLSKCLSDINCTEIANRNKLPIQKESSPEDDAWIRFQLEHLGPELIRETGGTPDSRVSDFIPDPWQKKLFDIVDKRQSALIVAPTSSGKTYASYYCMESVLREGTQGIVVYVAPTKALVNQVAATVYARFKDTKMPDGMSVYGIFTRDYRMYALNSQILVTVPQCLEILLLSPRRHSWVKRIRYIIFDEIHCIEGIGGAAFERCLLLTRCPFLALSATIRNPKGFHEWMQRAENYKHERDVTDGYPREKDSYKVHLVEHSERHSDLTKFTYGNGRLHHLHPYAELEASVIDKHKGIPSHMTLSPAETIQLYNTMHTVFPDCESLIQLSPVVFFSSSPENGFISRNSVRQYAAELSTVLTNWFYEYTQYFENTIKILKPAEVDEIDGSGRLYIRENIVDFVLHLKEQNMLPAIIFAYSRSMIKDMTVQTMRYFENYKKSNGLRTESINKQKQTITKPIEDRLETKKYKAKALQSYTGNAEKSLESISSNMVFIDKRNLRRRAMKYEEPLNLICEHASHSVQGIGVMDTEDMKFVERRLRQAGVNSKNLISRSMRNGLCMHHSGLGNKVRGAVEMLFRKKFLNVVFATGTLALGIHMPCKTTVIAGNSAWLNSLEYHQMSGRAGRRGYDTAGNVVFLGMNPRKQHSLLTAKLPSLKGNFPVTVSLILRTLLLVSDVTDKGKQSEEATKISISRVLTMLENSLCFMENPEIKINIKHFFSFTLQLLKIQEFINENGDPLKWCGLGTRLHYHEPGNLAFVYLLRTGVIRKICSETKNKEEIAYKLIIILSYLFTKVPLDAASKQKIYNNSIVILDPLPKIAFEALNQYNIEVRFVFEQYFANVASYFNEEDNILPLSSVKFIGTSSTEDKHSFGTENLENNFLNMCSPQIVCSSFAALSGNNDSNAYTEDTLISNLKQKMATDVKVIPLINLEAGLNSYALDFYKHGIVKSIIEDNGIKEGAEFTLLTDFLLVLKTIRVVLEEMKVETETDIVYRHFKLLEEKYSELHATAFGRDHM